MRDQKEIHFKPVKWRFVINYGPDGETDYANVYDERGQYVANLKIHHATAIVESMNNKPSALAQQDKQKESE